MQIDREAVKNILAVRNDRFGEFLLNIPSFRALKETFTRARLTVVIDPYLKGLAGSVPFVDELIEWGRVRHTLPEKIRLVNLLKIKKIDIAVILNPSRDFNIFTYLVGIPVRVGYNRKLGFLLTHKMEDRKYLGLKHEIEYNLELVSLLGAKTGDKALSFKIDDNIINGLCQSHKIDPGESLVAIHPWTSDIIKQWPVENFARLAQRLTKELNKKVVIIGAQEEAARSREYFSNSGQAGINLTGKTSLIQLAALLKKCKLLISGDSGPMHLASCAVIPVLAIFSNNVRGKGPLRWGPTSNGSVVVEKARLSDITVEEVFLKAEELLR